MTEAILRERRDGIEVVAINRPEVGNAIDLATIRRLLDVVAELERDDTLRAVVLTGSGDRAFVTGGDLRDFLSLQTQQAARHMALSMQDALARLELLDVPVICALNGHAFGGGCEVALACDLRVAAESAELGLPEVTVGLIPGWGGTQRLVRLAGRGVAKDLVFTGRRLAAREALELGVVNRVVHDDALLETCRELAARIRRASPIAVRQAKKAIDEGAELSLDQGLVLEAEAWLVNFCASDRVEGLRAFVEKRRPVYRGRHGAKG